MVNEHGQDAPLGPFQEIWEAWEEVRSDIVEKDIYHFQKAVEIQFVEINEHLDREDKDAAAREAVDIISIALNTLRMLGYSPHEIAEIAKMRARRRMSGQTRSILDKYEKLHGI